MLILITASFSLLKMVNLLFFFWHNFSHYEYTFSLFFFLVCKFRLPETHPALESSADLSAGTARAASSQAKSRGKLTRKLVFSLSSNLFFFLIN